MKTIIAPTDFSPISLNAVDYAADMACVLGNSLALVTVCAFPVPISEVPVPGYGMNELLIDAQEQIGLLKNKLLARTNGKIKIFTEVRQGFIVAQIKEYCELINPYAVVMGTERGNAFERAIMGAATFSAMTEFSWPVIAVPPGIGFSGIRKIGLACDLKNVVETVPAKEIKDLVQEFHAELHILHVDTDGSSFTPEDVEGSAFLQEMLGSLHPAYHFVDGTDAEKVISEFAANNDFDLLFVLPKKHSLLEQLFIRSHSKRLVLQTHVPVIAVHE